MINLLLVAFCSLLVGHAWGCVREWHRVLDYLDRHLDRDADWLRSGIACNDHHDDQRT